MLNIFPLAKQGYYDAMARLYPQRIVFHHVPKCGGSSVGRAFRLKYLLSFEPIDETAVYAAARLFWRDRNFTSEEDAADIYRRMLLAYFIEHGVGCISGHARFDPRLHERYRAQCKFVTLLRNPVERLISAYYYDLNRPNKNKITCPLEEFADSERGRHYGRLYPYFFGLTGEICPATGKSLFSMEAAKAALDKFDAVGVVEDLPSFEKQLAERAGVSIRIGHVNKGETRASKAASIAPALLRKLEDICAPDIELYEYARSLAAQPAAAASAAR